MTISLEEHVARAICAELGHDPDVTFDVFIPGDPDAIWSWAGYRRHARAAIAAVREHTPAGWIDPGLTTVLERCAAESMRAKSEAIARSYAMKGRFQVGNTWKKDLLPTEVYETAAIDISGWIANDIAALKP